MEVRREDQEKINRFSSLHQKETALEEELRGKIVSLHTQLCAGISQLIYKQKEKEDLEEISTELELVDEEEKVPYVP
jgi:prefoldin subunit 4